MTEDSNRAFPLMMAIGAGMAAFATFLPWYSFEVVLPVAPVVHIFAVTTTCGGSQRLRRS